MNTTPTPVDPAALVDALDADAIRMRLAELDHEARALRVLLRAARARQRRGRGAITPRQSGGPPHAA